MGFAFNVVQCLHELSKVIILDTHQITRKELIEGEIHVHANSQY